MSLHVFKIRKQDLMILIGKPKQTHMVWSRNILFYAHQSCFTRVFKPLSFQTFLSSRTVLLKLSSVGVLMISLYTTLIKRKPRGTPDAAPCDNLFTPGNDTDIDNTGLATVLMSNAGNSTAVKDENDIQVPVYSLC